MRFSFFLLFFLVGNGGRGVVRVCVSYPGDLLFCSQGELRRVPDVPGARARALAKDIGWGEGVRGGMIHNALIHMRICISHIHTDIYRQDTFIRASVCRDTPLHPAGDRERTRPKGGLGNPTSVMPGQEPRKPTLGHPFGVALGKGREGESGGRWEGKRRENEGKGAEGMGGKGKSRDGRRDRKGKEREQNT